MGMVVKRFDVYLVNLDPTVGTESRKTRPGVAEVPVVRTCRNVR